MKKILVYGDANLDIFITEKREVPAPGTEEYVSQMPFAVGGGAALVAMGLGKLQCNPAFLGVMSGDKIGKMLTESMEAVGVDMSKASIDDTVGSGISLSFTDEKDRSFISYAGSIGKLSTELIFKTDFSDVGHVHMTGYNPDKHVTYLEVLKFIKSHSGVTCSFDVAFDESGRWNPAIVELMAYVDVFFMNEVEAAGYSKKDTPEEAAAFFAEYGCTAVVKAGKKGSYLKKKGEEYIFEASNAVKAVDTTGAGDSFNAGFLYAYVNRMDDRTALRCGNYCGGRVVTALGGNTAFPTLSEMKKDLGI